MKQCEQKSKHNKNPPLLLMSILFMFFYSQVCNVKHENIDEIQTHTGCNKSNTSTITNAFTKKLTDTLWKVCHVSRLLFIK